MVSREICSQLCSFSCKPTKSPANGISFRDEIDTENEDEKPKNAKLASLIEKARQVVNESEQRPEQRRKRLVKRAKKKSPEQSPKPQSDSSSDDDLPLSRRFNKEMKNRRMSLNTVVEKLKASSASSSTESNNEIEKPREQQQAVMSSSAMSSRMSDGSSSDYSKVDFSAAAIKKRVSLIEKLSAFQQLSTSLLAVLTFGLETCSGPSCWHTWVYSSKEVELFETKTHSHWSC